MDSKLSEYPQAIGIAASDLVPVISGGANKIASIGVIALNLPNIGNKGITKNAPVEAASTSIPLTSTVVTLPVIIGSYVLSDGVDGQEITLLSLDVNVVIVQNSQVTSISMSNGSSVTLIFATRWFIKSYHDCALT